MKARYDGAKDVVVDLRPQGAARAVGGRRNPFERASTQPQTGAMLRSSARATLDGGDRVTYFTRLFSVPVVTFHKTEARVRGHSATDDCLCRLRPGDTRPRPNPERITCAGDACTAERCGSRMLTQGGQGGRPAPLASRLHRIPTHFLLNLHGFSRKLPTFGPSDRLGVITLRRCCFSGAICVDTIDGWGWTRAVQL